MKFYCLTSVILEPNNTTENETINAFTNYCLTLIEIGPNEHHLNVFTFQRENVEKISLLMKPGSITIKSINSNESGIIELEFSSDASCSDDYQTKSMRISNIKITKNTSVSDDERKKYYDLIAKLNQVVNVDESAKKLIKKAKFYILPKSLKNRLRDFQKLIQTFCDPNTATAQIPKTAKYLQTTTLKGEEDVLIDKNNYHQRKRDNKNHWSKLSFELVTMPRFDDLWFDALNLKELNISDVKFTDISQEAWTLFASGIEKLRFLKKLEMYGNFDEIPDIVFRKLPVSLQTLTLYRLKSIPEDIGRLKNLRELSIAGNRELINIPWEHLPVSLIDLKLMATGIINVPSEISKLVNLESLTFAEIYPIGKKFVRIHKESAQISWISINKNIKFLHVSHIENLADSKFGNFKMLEELKITDCYRLEDFDVNLLPSTLKKISLINFYGFVTREFKCNFDFPYLNELDLSNNHLEEFPFECITKPMTEINLSRNRLTKLILRKNITNIKHLDLSWNEISIVTIEESITDFGRDKGMVLNLRHNAIRKLPPGFEKLPIKKLNLCKNTFSTKNMDIRLWERLPENLVKLNISKHKIERLPCMLKNFSSLTEIIAIDCELESICPRIFGNLLGERKCCLDIRKNDHITGLPFAPSKIFPHIQNLVKPFRCKKEWEDFEECSELFVEPPMITWTYYYDEVDTPGSMCAKVLTDKTLLNLQHTRTIDLTFRPISLLQNPFCPFDLPDRDICSCCAKCGNETEESFVEQLMTMDFELFQEQTKNDEVICNYWQTKTWKTMVMTRFCTECIEQYNEEAKELNLANKRKANDDEEEEVLNDEMEPDIFMEDAMSDTVRPIYNEPQPCSSQRKIKKLQRHQSNVNQNSANDFVNSQEACQTSSNNLVLMEVDVDMQSASHRLNDEMNSERNEILQMETVPQYQFNNQPIAFYEQQSVHSTNSYANPGVLHEFNDPNNQQHVLTPPNESYHQNYYNPSQQTHSHYQYLYPQTNPQLSEQQNNYPQANHFAPQQHYQTMIPENNSYNGNVQNNVFPQSSSQDGIDNRQYTDIPTMLTHAEPQSLLPSISTVPSLPSVIPKSILLEILQTKTPIYAAGKFDSWIELNYVLEGIMDPEFSVIRSYMDSFKRQ